MGVVREYLDSLPVDARRKTLEEIDAIVREAVPDVGEITSYSLAAYEYHGRPLLAAVAYKQHLSVFPYSGAIVEQVADKLPGFDLNKGTIRFSEKQPLPPEVLREVIKLRQAEIDGGRK